MNINRSFFVLYLSFFFLQVPDLEVGSGYRITIYYSKDVSADSDSFSIADPCSYKSCGVNGQCVSGICVCTNGFSGDACEVGPCANAGCSPTSSTCNNTAIVTAPPPTLSSSAAAPPSPSCPCKSGWSGAQCHTPSLCSSLVCLHGGDLDPESLVLTNTSCTGSCSCVAGWTGSDCGVCGLQCANGGVADSSCSRCVCAAGYAGAQCKCAYYTLFMRFLLDASSWSQDSVAVRRFSRTLSTDLAWASINSPLHAIINASVESLDFTQGNRIGAKVRLAQPCLTASNMGEAGDMDTTITDPILPEMRKNSLDQPDSQYKQYIQGSIGERESKKLNK